jgi:hypothetical protein
VLWGDDDLSVPAEQVPVQNRRHACLHGHKPLTPDYSAGGARSIPASGASTFQPP